MTTPSCSHHVALRVDSLERSVAFYRDVFDAVQMTLPKRYDGPVAKRIIGADQDVSYSLCHIRVGDGFMELFEFHEPRLPQTPIDHFAAKIMHVGMHVEDAEAVAEKVMAAGGSRLMDEAIMIPDVGQVLTCLDPDNNVLELFEAPQHVVIEASLAANPQYRP